MLSFCRWSLCPHSLTGDLVGLKHLQTQQNNLSQHLGLPTEAPFSPTLRYPKAGHEQLGKNEEKQTMKHRQTNTEGPFCGCRLFYESIPPT